MLNNICSIALYVDDTTLSSKCDQTSVLWQQLEMPSEPESDLWDIVGLIWEGNLG